MNREVASGHKLYDRYEKYDQYSGLEPVLTAHLKAHKQGNRCAAAAFAHTSLPVVYRLLLREHMHIPDEHIQDAAVDAVLRMLGEVNRMNLSQIRVVAWLHSVARRRVADRMVRIHRTGATDVSSRRGH